MVGRILSLGITATVAAGKFLYVDPRDREIAILQRQLGEAKSDPESRRITLQLQQTQSNRDEWVDHAKNLELKLSGCNSNAMILAEISKLTVAKREADHSVDFFLSPSMNSGNEPSKSNLLRSEEYRRQATQLQEQILGLQSKISQ